MSGINLLPWRTWRRQRAVRGLQWMVLVSLLLGGVLAVAAAVQLDQWLAGHEQENARLDERINGLEGPLAAVEALRTERAALLAQDRELQRLDSRRQPFADLLARLAEIVPEHVRLDSLLLTSDALSLSGVARSGSEVAQLLRTLGQSPELDVPDLREVKSSVAGERFQMTAGLRQHLIPDPS